jgi:hypothetical protein
VVTDEEPIVIAEEPVPQIDDFADTEVEIIEPLHPIGCTPTSRATTSSDWPPAPPLPASLDDAFAIGTEAPRRRAQIYAAVRRPTTSGDSK